MSVFNKAMPVAELNRKLRQALMTETEGGAGECVCSELRKLGYVNAVNCIDNECFAGIFANTACEPSLFLNRLCNACCDVSKIIEKLNEEVAVGDKHYTRFMQLMQNNQNSDDINKVICKFKHSLKLKNDSFNIETVLSPNPTSTEQEPVGETNVVGGYAGNTLDSMFGGMATENTVTKLQNNLDYLTNKYCCGKSQSGGGLNMNTFTNSASEYGTLNQIIDNLKLSGGKSKKTKKSKEDNKKKSKKGKREVLMATPEGDGNPLSALLKSKKDHLFEQFQTTILKMLEEKMVKIGKSVVDATSDNAKTIKSYLYHKLRSNENTKNMTSSEKIQYLTKLTQDELSKMMKGMPSLEDIRSEIAEHINKNKNVDSDNITLEGKEKKHKKAKRASPMSDSDENSD